VYHFYSTTRKSES